MSTGVQRADELVGSLQLSQDQRRANPFEHRVAQWGREAVQDRGLHQELSVCRLELGQDLALEVVEQVAVVPLQPGDGNLWLGGAADCLRGELEADRPPLGALAEQTARGGVQVGDADRCQQTFGLTRGEGQLWRPDLGELSAPTPSAERQCRVCSACQDQAQRGRQVGDQELETL
jgi:hypothetical protein